MNKTKYVGITKNNDANVYTRFYENNVSLERMESRTYLVCLGGHTYRIGSTHQAF